MLKHIISKLREVRGDIGSLFGGGGNQVAGINVPTFQTDPNFTNSQNQLSTLGQQLLSGNLPAFYSSLGKANSPQFQAMLTNVEGQTNQQSQAAEAASGTARSGVGQAASALALNNVIPGLSYEDLLNSQQQQQGLLGLGANVTQDVAGNALQNQGQENQFAQANFQDQLAQSEYNNSYNLMQGQATGNLIGSGLGALAGGLLGGPAGALAGLGVGSSLTGGSGGGAGMSSLLSMLGQFGSPSSGTGITSNTAPALPYQSGLGANLSGLTFASGA